MSISQTIEQAVIVSREYGIEPNRVRMAKGTYDALCLEVLDADLAALRGKKMPKAVAWEMVKTIHGLTIEITDEPPSVLCSDGYVVVDCKPEEGE